MISLNNFKSFDFSEGKNLHFFSFDSNKTFISTTEEGIERCYPIKVEDDKEFLFEILDNHIKITKTIKIVEGTILTSNNFKESEETELPTLELTIYINDQLLKFDDSNDFFKIILEDNKAFFYMVKSFYNINVC